MPPDLWDSACRRGALQGKVGWPRADGAIAAGAEAVVEIAGLDVSQWVVYGEEGHGMDSARKRGPALQKDMHEAGHERSVACLGPDGELIRERCPFPAGAQRWRAWEERPE
jgi:hypothetical protein